MNTGRLPRAVALPDVINYSDNVVFGNLGLPVGFDEERILVNLRGIERIRRVARLGTVSVVGERGEAGQMDYQTVGITASGAALFGAVKKRPKNPLTNTETVFPTYSSFSDEPTVIISVNNSEIEARIGEHESRYPKGAFDPKARAVYLNKAVKAGLESASMDANVDRDKLKQALKYYGIFGIIGLVTSSNLERYMSIMTLLGPVIANAAKLKSMSMPHITDNNDRSEMEEWRRLRQSLFVGPAFDRWALAGGLVKTSKVVKSRNSNW